MVTAERSRPLSAISETAHRSAPASNCDEAIGRRAPASVDVVELGPPLVETLELEAQHESASGASQDARNKTQNKTNKNRAQTKLGIKKGLT